MGNFYHMYPLQHIKTLQKDLQENLVYCWNLILFFKAVSSNIFSLLVMFLGYQDTEMNDTVFLWKVIGLGKCSSIPKNHPQEQQKIFSFLYHGECEILFTRSSDLPWNIIQHDRNKTVGLDVWEGILEHSEFHVAFYCLRTS